MSQVMNSPFFQDSDLSLYVATFSSVLWVGMFVLKLDTGCRMFFTASKGWPNEPRFARLEIMKPCFTYWKESDGRFLGYLNDYPDHWTQGENLDDLKDQLRDLYQTFGSEQIPGIRKVEELEIA
jgi:hypothetical protein